MTSSRIICSVTCRPRCAFAKIIRCALSERWWTKSSLNSPGGSTQCTPRGPSVDCAREIVAAQLLKMLYSIRSERLLMEEMDYNLLFRWFVGLNADDEVWDATVFTKNRDRLLEADIAKEFLARVVEQAGAKGLTSDEHFTVDGTLLEAWASAKEFPAQEETVAAG